MKKTNKVKQNKKENLDITSSETSDEPSEEKTGWWS